MWLVPLFPKALKVAVGLDLSVAEWVSHTALNFIRRLIQRGDTVSQRLPSPSFNGSKGFEDDASHGVTQIAAYRIN
jgi:hypothetical protein